MKYLLLFLFFLSLKAPAQSYFDFNTNCQNAYKELLSLRLTNGQRLLNEEKRARPNNLFPLFLENYADFFSLFFNEDPAEFDRKSSLKSSRLAAMRRGPKESPWYLFTQSILQVQWAAIQIKFGEKWSAGWSFKAAFDLAKDNQKAFPNFVPNDLVMGPLQVAAGSIPRGYQWLSNMMGIKGNIQTGMGKLTHFINSNDPNATAFREEACFYYCYLAFHVENKPGEALSFIREQKLDVVNNHLFAYMGANLSLNNQQSAAAVRFVSGRNPSAEYMVSPMWDFEMAYARLYHLEPEAVVYFDRFHSNFKGNFYVKDSWLKTGWLYLLQGNTARYLSCLEMVRSKGNTDTDADKRALKEAKLGRTPNLVLLKARLLSDGGYTSEAYQLLAGKSVSEFTSPEDQLEFSYRAGRINESLGKFDEAIQAYLATIKMGRDRPEYFAARAALQTGLIYEQQKNNKPLAAAFYRQCLAMEDHDYKNSLDQRAKSGIQRCENAP